MTALSRYLRSPKIIALHIDSPTHSGKRKIIKGVIDRVPLGEPFEWPALTLLIEKALGTTRWTFRKSRPRPGRNGYQFEGLDETGLWRPISWSEAVGAPDGTDLSTATELISRQLRELVYPFTRRYLSHHPRCEKCRYGASVQVHHQGVKWSEMLAVVCRWLEEDGTRLEEFVTREGWKVELALRCRDVIEWHNQQEFQALCHDCHEELTRAGK